MRHPPSPALILRTSWASARQQFACSWPEKYFGGTNTKHLLTKSRNISSVCRNIFAFVLSSFACYVVRFEFPERGSMQSFHTLPFNYFLLCPPSHQEEKKTFHTPPLSTGPNKQTKKHTRWFQRRTASGLGAGRNVTSLIKSFPMIFCAHFDHECGTAKVGSF